MSVLGLDSGYTVKYNPLPSGVPSGFAIGNSFRQKVIFDRISLCLKEFPKAKPKGTPEGKGVYLTVYPESSPNMGSISF